MDVIAEEGLEINTDPAEASGGIQGKSGIFDTDNHFNLSRTRRVRKDFAFVCFRVDLANIVSADSARRGVREV